MRSVSASELIRDPVGGYFAGRSVIVWVQAAHRLGAVHRSPLDVADAAPLATLFPLPLQPSLRPPLDLLDDLSAVDSVDHRAFEWAETFLSGWIGEIASRTRRVAVVRPSGLAGATFTGLFHDWTTRFSEARLFQRRTDALGWLEVEPDARQEIDDLHDAFTSSPLMRRLREALANDLQDATIERIAGALAMSARSLQRHLSACSTTFSDELARARIRAAEAMLLDGDDKIATIARVVGFRSAAGFTTMFRRVNSEPPVVFRNRAVALRRRPP